MMNHLTKTLIFGLLSTVMFGAQANEHQHGEMMNAAPAAQQTPARLNPLIWKAKKSPSPMMRFRR